MQAVEFAGLRRKPFQNRYGRASKRYMIDDQFITEGSICPTKYRCGKIEHGPNLKTYSAACYIFKMITSMKKTSVSGCASLENSIQKAGRTSYPSGFSMRATLTG